MSRLRRIAGFLGALVFLAGGGPVLSDSVAVLGSNGQLVAGAQALSLGRYTDGLALTRAGLREVISFDDRAAALNNLCAGYTGLRFFDIAIIYCSESLELAPANWHAYNNRALAYLGKGMLSLAQRDVLRGLEINAQAGQLQQVRVLVDEAFRLHPLGPQRGPPG